MRFCPLFADEACLVEAPIGGLPLPMHRREFLTMVDQERPEFVEDAFVFPALEGAMYGGIVAELFWQMVPLAAGSGAVDDPVQTFPGVGAGSSHLGCRIELCKQRREELLPKRIGYFPDGWQGIFIGGRHGYKEYSQ